MNPIVYAIPVFLLTIALEWGTARALRRDVYGVVDALTSLQLGVLSQLSGAATKLVTFGLYVLVYQSVHIFTWSTSAAPQWLLALVLYDFLYYWNHRLNHEVALLWAGHVVHHSSERFNLTTALRQSATSSLTGWIFYMPMALIGAPPVMFGVVALIDLLYQYWVHTELVGRLGILDKILVTPSNHRVHHGQNDYCIDRNYGGVLIVWDLLFGTFAEERPKERIVFGVRKPLARCNPFVGNLHVYADLVADARRAQGLAAKASVFLASPSRPDGRPAAAFDPSGFRPYRPEISTATAIYAGLQYLGLTGGLVVFLAHFNGFGTLGAVALAGLLGATLLAQGALLEGAPFALPLEAGRLVLIAGAALAAPHVLGADAAPGAGIAVAAAAAASLVSLPLLRRPPLLPAGSTS